MTTPTHDGLAGRAAAALTAYRAGDPTHLSTLVDEVTPMLWHLARRQGLDPAAAEDVVQTTWLRLMEGAERIEDPYAVLKWLMTTTRREAWRVARVGRRSALTDLETDALPETPTGAPDLGDSIAERDLGATLWRHVRTLSQRCQDLLSVIAFADRPDYAALSAALGMPVGSIGPTRGRCLAKLRALLDADTSWEVTA